MDKFIIVFLSMIITLILAKYLTYYDHKDIILNFENKQIKCKCNLNDVKPDIKEKFSKYSKNIVINKPPVNKNIITSIGNLNNSKHINITAEKFYEKYFTYPLKPFVINKY